MNLSLGTGSRNWAGGPACSLWTEPEEAQAAGSLSHFVQANPGYTGVSDKMDDDTGGEWVFTDVLSAGYTIPYYFLAFKNNLKASWEL